MIPLELRLKNFLSYGEEEIVLDFSSLHTVCLSGENGHGKSALLDSITWALWGETRLGRQNHEQLIRIGADEMSVVFTFAEGGETYRVRRQRSKRAAGQLWELQQADGAGGWRPLTGVNNADTGKAIQQIVRMSYDTFLNSAYLKQGRADEFVRQTPGKRKEILAEVLELNRYDQLEAKARARRSDAAERTLDAERALNQIEKELAEEPAHQEALIACQDRALSLAGERDVATAKWEKLRELLDTLQRQRDQAKRLEEEFRSLSEEIANWQREREGELEAIEREKALLKDGDKISSDYLRLQEARALAETLSEKVRAAQQVQKKRIALEAEIDRCRYELERRLEAAQKTYLEARTQVDELPLLGEQLNALNMRLAALNELQIEENGLRARKEKLMAEFAGLKAEKKHGDEALQKAYERLDKIGQQEDVCSVCGSPLPFHKIAAITEERKKEIAAIECDQKRLTQEGRSCRQEIEACDIRLSEIAGSLQGTQKLRDEIVLRNQVIQGRQSLVEALPDLQQQALTLMQDLETGNFAKEARVHLDSVIGEEKQLQSVDKELDEAARTARLFINAERQYHALQHAQEKLAVGEKRLARADHAIETLLARQTQKLEEREALSGIEPKYQETEQVLSSLRSHLEELGGQAARIEQERGRLQQILARCTQLRQEQARLNIEQNAARKEEEAYAQLAAAFSKRGVQALIIEKALPELQNEANELLERLTDGDMSLSIQTTRAAKSRAAGDTPIETLDIHVSDSLGTRPLEIYSGGETFRISFALRIALSHLLARRAGASLQTLIIDEGFGTQDAKGREKLVDAINAIKDEFARIIVVTHIDELKEAFPARIEVVKTPTGSEATIIEGGMIG